MSFPHISFLNKVLDLLSEPIPQDLPVSESLVVYATISFLEKSKKIKKLKESFRPMLKAYAQEHGVLTGKTFKLVMQDMGQATLVCKDASQPNIDKLLALLATKKIPKSAACDEVRTWEPNKEKLDLLVETGLLTKEELKSTFPVLEPALSCDLHVTMKSALEDADQSP